MPTALAVAGGAQQQLAKPGGRRATRALGGGSVGYALIGALVVVLGLAGAFRRRKETSSPLTLV